MKVNLEEYKCPNCGGNHLYQDGEFIICANCSAMYKDTSHFKVTKTNINITIDETKIEKIKAQERKEVREKHEEKHLLIGIAIFFTVLTLIILIINVVVEKEIPAPEMSASAYRNVRKDIVANALLDAGFTDVQQIPLNDLRQGEENKDGIVENVTIGGEDSWTADIFLNRKKYKISIPVKIYYHSIER